MKSFFISAIALLALPVTSAHAQDLLIRGAKVHTASTQGTLENTDVLVRAGKISAVGSALTAPAGVAVVEAKGRPVTPGLFAGLSAVGLIEVAVVSSSADSGISFDSPRWQQQWRPEFDVLPAYNPRSSVIPVTRMEGVTWAVLAPWSGDGVISGQGGGVTFNGQYDAALEGSRTLFVSLGGDNDLSGGSRAGHFMLLEQAIREARATEAPREGALLNAKGREILKAYLTGGRIVFAVDRASDIHQLLLFAQRNGIRPILKGAAEGWVVADEIARARVPVIMDPMENLPGNFDNLGARLDNAAILHRAGVRLAFSSGELHNARKMRQVAGNAVAHGLPWETALAGLTSQAADIFGLGATRGRIAPGQAADIVLWSGDPLEVTTVADQVWFAGRPIDMRSRQTELRDRYRLRQ